MRTLGIWLVIFGIGSYVLPLLGVQFIILLWIYTWGPTTALVIQGAMVLAGIGLIVAGWRRGRGKDGPTA